MAKDFTKKLQKDLAENPFSETLDQHNERKGAEQKTPDNKKTTTNPKKDATNPIPKEEKPKNDKRISLYVPERMYKNLSFIASFKDMSVNQLILDCISAKVTDKQVKELMAKELEKY